MKNIKLFNKILLSISIIFIMVILILFVLGSFNRIGYLSEFKINIDNTLKLNGFNVESVKESFTIDNVLDKISITNYLVTNISITNYSYDFRIKYYSKIFRNSDIYGVYLNTNSLPDYIKDIKFDKKGSPFGVLISDRLIENNINNIQYSLKVKFRFYIIVLLIFIVLSFLIYILRNIVLNLLTFLSYIINSNITKYVFVLIIFLCFLIMPNIVYNLFGSNFDKTNYEKRTKAEKPILSITNLVNYPIQYEKYFNDYIPFRNELIQLKNVVDIKIFRNIISDKAIFGKDNWLFHKPFPLVEDFIGIYDLTDEELEIAKNNLINFRDELKKRNIDFIFMVCPNKHLIYEENMPDYIKRKTKINATDKFIEYMEKNTDIKIVYPKKELLKYKDKYQLYYKYDTHWNEIGAYIGYNELMKEMNIETISLDHLKLLTNGNMSGDIAAMINSTKIYSDDIIYVLEEYTNNNYKVVKEIEDYYDFFYCESDANNTNNILMIRDSFTTAMFDYIASSFRKSSFIHMAKFKYNYILDKNPNIVVYQTVEMGLGGSLFGMIPSYKIEKINKDLETNFIVTNN